MNRDLLQQCLDLLTELDKDGVICEMGLILELRNALGIPDKLKMKAELSKPQNEFHPDWDTLKPYYDRIAELEAQLALDKKAANARKLGLDYKPDHGFDRTASHMAGEYIDTNQQNVNTYEERVQKMCICEHIQRCTVFNKCMKGC